MHELALAIDFGITHTKVAWRDEQGKVSLLRFGDSPYLPSLFYLPEGSDDILLGQEAVLACEEEPLGVVEALKRLIVRDNPIYTTEDRSTDTQPVLVQLFRYIKQYALETISDFHGQSPDQIMFTMPGTTPEILEIKLRLAAREVAWDHPQFLAEPLAAARYWLEGQGHAAGEKVLVVLDCGGGTTDFACIQRNGQQIHLAEKYAPSAINVGGRDVDKALSDWVASQQPELHAARPEPRLRDQLRAWKEAVFKGEESTQIRIKGKQLTIIENDLYRVYRENLIDKFLPAFERFLEPIVHEHPETQVLIVGGSVTELLENAILDIHSHVYCCREPQNAVVFGALIEMESFKTHSATDDLPKNQINSKFHTSKSENLMNKEHFTESLVKEIERDSSLSEVAKAIVFRNLARLRDTKVNVLITGATGCGKSSTINALFNQEHAKVGTGPDPETMEIATYEYDNLVLFDSPGLGDGKEADLRHSKNIIDKLYEKDVNGNLLIDLVLVILDGGSRDLGTSFELINSVIIPNIGDDKKRLLVAINQADMAMKGRHWNREKNAPEPELIKFLDEKIASTQRRIKEATDVDIEPIYYVAGYKDGDQEQKPYNLSKLLLFILKHTKEDKRAAFVQDLNRDRTMWVDDDRLEDYREEVRQTFWSSVTAAAVSGAEKGSQVGAEIGRFFGSHGESIGRSIGSAVGSAVGAIGGFVKSLFGW